MTRISTPRLASAVLLAIGSIGFAQAATTYTYTYSYNWTVPSSCANGIWNPSCAMSGGTRTLASATPPGAPADPNLPAASISSTATGWANTSGGGDASLQPLEKGEVTAWSGTGGYGLGIRNNDYSTGADANEGTSPEHAVDNDGRFDSMLYSFGSSLALSSVALSYASNDSDIVVLAYNASRGGAWNQATKLAGQTYANLVSLGWDLIGNYTNLTVGSAGNAINDTGVSSSYWLVGAANNLVSGGVNDSSKDYMKLAALGGTITTKYTPSTPPGVPEPGSLALLGLGALLLLRARAKS